jgi:phenylalanyl-tRNA synthetase beta chain
MKVSYNWLKDYIKTDLTPTRISEILTETGLEVDGIEKIEGIKGGLEGVFVGEVLSCEKHPDADKLKAERLVKLKERRALKKARDAAKLVDVY